MIPLESCTYVKNECVWNSSNFYDNKDMYENVDLNGLIIGEERL